MFNVSMRESDPVSLDSRIIDQSSTIPVRSQSWKQSNHLSERGSYGGVRLKKGQKINLAKVDNKPLRSVRVGLCWDASPGYDLDSSCFLLGADGKVIGDEWFVYYGYLHSPDYAVQHSGDCRDGSIDGDDEVISIDSQRLDPRIQRLVFVVTINDAKIANQNFSGVSNAAIHIQNADTNQDLCSFKLTEYYSNVISMMVGEIYRHNGLWKFNPIGEGTNDDLYGLCVRYGVHVVD